MTHFDRIAVIDPAYLRTYGSTAVLRDIQPGIQSPGTLGDTLAFTWTEVMAVCSAFALVVYRALNQTSVSLAEAVCQAERQKHQDFAGVACAYLMSGWARSSPRISPSVATNSSVSASEKINGGRSLITL